MEDRQESTLNPYIRLETVPEICPCPDCETDISPDEATESTRKGFIFRATCPTCGLLFDQACPRCGSKDIQTAEGVEECLHCGEVLQLGSKQIQQST